MPKRSEDSLWDFIETKVKTIHLPEDYTVNFSKFYDDSSDIKFIAELLNKIDLNNFCLPNMTISIATFKSVVLSVVKVCFNYILLDCPDSLAAKDCLDMFSSYGPFLLFPPLQGEFLVRLLVLKSYTMLNQRYDMKMLREVIRNNSQDIIMTT